MRDTLLRAEQEPAEGSREIVEHELRRSGLAKEESRPLSFDVPGWRMAGAGGFRRLSDGTVESHGGPGLFWYAAEIFEDFFLSVEWRTARLEDNSGIFLRIPPLADSPQPAIDRGYEVQIDDRGFDPASGTLGSPLHLTGAIYRLAPAVGRYSHPPGSWNRFEITAEGSSIGVRLNGHDICSLQNASRERRGHIGLQSHHEGSAVQFRKLHIAAASD